MITALLPFGQAMTPPPVDAGGDITVLARKLEGVSVWLAPDANGKLSCGMNRSSGQPGLDARLCKTAARCHKDGATDNAAMKACIDARKPALLNDFAAALRSGKEQLQ